MDELKKLFQAKRILAMMLAAAMVITMLPTTAYAAAPSTVLGATEESVPEETVPATEESVPVEETTDKDESLVLEANKESVPEETIPVDEEGALAEETTDEDESPESTSESEKEILPDVDGTEAAIDEAPSEDGVEGEVAGIGYVLKDSRSDAQKIAAYDASEHFVDSNDATKIDSNILWNIELVEKVNGEESGTSYYLTDSSTIIQSLTYRWQTIGADGNGTDMAAGKVPQGAGSYRLVITLPAGTTDGGDAYEGQEFSLEFEITPAPVTVEFSIAPIKAGSAAGDVTVEDVSVYSSSDGRTFSYLTGENAADSEIALALDVKDVYTGEVLGKTDKLEADKDYVLDVKSSFTAKVTDAANYEIQPCEERRLPSLDAKEAAVTIQLAEKFGKEPYAVEKATVYGEDVEVNKITGVFDNNAWKWENGDFTAKVVELTETATVDVAGSDKITGSWHTASYDSWMEYETDDNSVQTEKWYCNLAVGATLTEAPKDAGIYVYRLSYTDENGVYGDAYADIVVEIGMAELFIEPYIADADNNFFVGQTAGEVLKKLGYKVLNNDADYSENKTITADKYFWGTAYGTSDVDPEYMTQPYKPVFDLAVTSTSADGKTVNIEKTLGLSDKLEKLPEGQEYKAVFTGYKAVYGDYEPYGDTQLYWYPVDINNMVNSANANYRVLTEVGFPKTINVIEGTEVTIDTSKIEEAFEKNGWKALSDFHNAASKVYDGVALYPNRSSYKQADVVDAAKKSVIGSNGTDVSLTYSWYENTAYDNYMDAQLNEAELADEEGIYSYNYTRNGDFQSAWERYYGISPKDAGIYKLEIEYKDKKAKYFARETKVLYFVIEQQQAVIVPMGTYNVLSDSITVSEFLNEHCDDEGIYDFEYSMQSVSELWYYDVDWWIQVETENTETQEKMFEDAESYDKFDSTKKYQLVARSFYDLDFNFTGTKTEIADVKDAEGKVIGKAVEKTWLSAGAAPITVDEMGSKIVKLNLENPLTGYTKVYDGNVDKEMQDAVKGIKLVDENGNDVAGAELTLTWKHTYHDIWYASTIRIVNKELADASQAYNGGTYEVWANFRGNTVFKALDLGAYSTVFTTDSTKGILVATGEITQGTITIEPKAPVGIKAGTRASDAAKEVQNLENLVIAGYNKENPIDFMGFTYGDVYRGQYYAWSVQPTFAVYDSTGTTKLGNNEVLKGENEYVLRVDSAGTLTTRYMYMDTLDSSIPLTYYDNYKVVISPELAKFKTQRATSTIEVISYSDIQALDYIDDEKNGSHTLTVRDGIPHGSYSMDSEEKLSGNLVAVRITPPAEYEGSIPDTAFYEKSIEKAGGYLVSGSEESGESYITMIFEASAYEEASKSNPKFEIRWEDGYVENFELKLKEAAKLADLSKAVAPKSLTFNTPEKKMIVGAEQQLDVKITKAQKSDIICLGYKVEEDGKGILTVDEKGKVTALKTGSGTVSVYPMYLKDGKKTEILSAKKASVKITVAKVTAPKAVKAVVLGEAAVNVQYTWGNYQDGFRREIYVAEGKNLKANYFEDGIARMEENGLWQEYFAAEPTYLTYSDEAGYRVWDSKKNAHTNTVQYAIDGLQRETDYTVYVRNISEVRTLSDGSKVEESVAGSLKSFKTTKGQVKDLVIQLQEDVPEDNVFWDIDDGKWYVDWRTVPLSKGKTSLSVKGLFVAVDSDPVEITEYDEVIMDGYWLPLALEKPYKSAYENPKLSYYFCYKGYGRDEVTGNYVYDGWYRSSTSDYATIDKNGKITLKQATITTGDYWYGDGDICLNIVAVDSASGVESNFLRFRITAEPDAIKAKNTTLQVGQSVSLEDLVDYLQNKKVIKGDFVKDVKVVDESVFADNANFVYADGKITAIGEKGKIVVELKDACSENTVKVTIKSTTLSPVKNLQLVDVIDNKFTIQFEESPYAEGYRIEVTDARGAVLRSAYVKSLGSDLNQNDRSVWSTGNWNEKTKKYDICKYVMKGLTQQSKYNVKVTALYDKVASKTMAKASSTTKLPAVVTGVEVVNKSMTGVEIPVYGTSGVANAYLSVVSGNSYTVRALLEKDAARDAATDKLTWTSSNPKVATIKANVGSFSASLKAVKQGSTIITVKSGITKEEWKFMVSVNAVGDAYASGNRYFGDNENLRGDYTIEYETIYRELEFGKPAAVTAAGTWFTFTAPESGTYRFYRVLPDGTRVNGGINPSSVRMEKGETIKIQATAGGEYSLNVEKVKAVTPLTQGDTEMYVENGQKFVFTAPEAGFYYFGGPFSYVYDSNGELKANRPACQMEKGEKVSLSANSSGNCKINVMETTLNGEEYYMPAESYSSVWFKYTAAAEGEYTFEVVADDGQNSANIRLYNSSNIQVGSGADSVSTVVGKGEGILVNVNVSQGFTLKVSKKEVISLTKDTPSAIELSDDYAYFTFTVSSAGFYQFAFDNSGNRIEMYLLKNLTDTESIDYQNGSSSTTVKGGHLDAGEVVYIKAKAYYGSTFTAALTAENYEPEAKNLAGYINGDFQISANSGSSQWYSFTSTKKAGYKLTFTKNYSYSSYRGNVYLYTMEDDGKLTEIKELNDTADSTEVGSCDVELEANGKIYCKIENTSINNLRMNVEVTENITPIDLSTSDTTGKLITLDSINDTAWVKFTGSEVPTGDYRFSFDGASGSGWMYVYDTLDAANGVIASASSSNPLTVTIAENETIYLKVTLSGSNFSGTLKVEVPAGNDSAGTEKTVVLNEDGKGIVQFTPEDAGIYKFDFSAGSRGIISLDPEVSSYASDRAVSGSDSVIYAAKAGETVTLYVERTYPSDKMLQVKMTDSGSKIGGDVVLVDVDDSAETEVTMNPDGSEGSTLSTGYVGFTASADAGGKCYMTVTVDAETGDTKVKVSSVSAGDESAQDTAPISYEVKSVKYVIWNGSVDWDTEAEVATAGSENQYEISNISDGDIVVVQIIVEKTEGSEEVETPEES